MIRLLACVCFAGLLAGCSLSSDGEQLWRFELQKACMQWGVADSQRLYLCADNVYCLDIDSGRLLWKFKTFGTLSSGPVIDGGRLFFQCGGLYALDASTGSVLWEFWTNDWASAAPAVSAGRVYAPAGESLYCVDAAGGRRLWSLKTGAVVGTPVAIGDRLFFTTGETIFCVDGALGQLVWQFGTGCGRVHLLGAGNSVLSVGSEGRVRSHHIETGQVQWQFDTGVPLVRFFVVPDGHIVLSAGELYCLDPHSGAQVWTFSREGDFVFDAQSLGQYVIAQGLGYGFFCVGLRDGAFIRPLSVPDGGRLLTYGKGATFFPGGISRTVSCISVPEL